MNLITRMTRGTEKAAREAEIYSRPIPFELVKRGDTVKCLEGCHSGQVIKVRNRRPSIKTLKYIHESPTGRYLCSVGDCNSFELIERA